MGGGAGDRFPLSLSQGYVLDMVPGRGGTAYPELAPSLLGSTYLTAQGRRRLLVGATKRPGLTPEEAFLVLPISELIDHIRYSLPAALNVVGI